MIEVGAGRDLPDFVGRIQKDGALGVALVLAEGNVFNGHAEEAGEAHGLDGIAGGFESAPEDFRADVDAENGLGGRALRSGGRGCVDVAEELTLPSVFVGELPEEANENGVGGAGLADGSGAPEFPQRGTFELCKEGGVVSEPNREEMHEGVVFLSGHAVFANEILHVSGPAADAHELAMEEVGGLIG